MDTTPEYGFPYAEPGDPVQDFPENVSKPLAEGVESALASDMASTLDSARDYTNDRTPQVSIDTSVGTRVMEGDVMAYGMTGNRNVTGLVDDATGGQMQLSRTGYLVELDLVNLMLSSTAVWAPLATLPIGFRPQAAAVEAQLIGSSSAIISVRRVDGRIDINRLGPEIRHKLTFVYTTADPWPATLPGTPA